MTDDKEISDGMKDILDDDDLRKFFEARDPNRKKVNPFQDDDAAIEHTGKASALTRMVPEAVAEKEWGVSYTEHQRHLKETSRNFTWIGFSGGLGFAILLVTFVKLAIL